MDPLVLLDRVAFRPIGARLVTGQAFGPRGAASSDLRGALGKALFELPGYAELFEPALRPDEAPRAHEGGNEAPRPYVLRGPEPPRLPRGGGSVDVELVSFHVEDEAMELFAHALVAGAGAGFGEPWARFDVEGLWIGDPVCLGEYARERWEELAEGREEADLRLWFVTPARLLSGGRSQAPSLPALVSAILRRVNALAWLYGEAPPRVSFEPLVALADRVQAWGDARASLRWCETSRYSFRQRRDVPLDGVVGAFEARVPASIGRVLLAAEVVHVGKGSTQGLGRVLVERADGGRAGRAGMGDGSPEPRGAPRPATGGAAGKGNGRRPGEAEARGGGRGVAGRGSEASTREAAAKTGGREEGARPLRRIGYRRIVTGGISRRGGRGGRGEGGDGGGSASGGGGEGG